jgi:ribosome-associated protein
MSSMNTNPDEPGRQGIATSDAEAFAIEAARIAADNLTADVVVLDMRGLSNVADFFVIGTGTSDRQMHAVLEAVEKYARSAGRAPFTTSDKSRATWLIADYVDVVVHVFDDEHRDYYDLDGLWGDAPRIVWQRPDQVSDHPTPGT